jgi:hypothetical protein
MQDVHVPPFLLEILSAQPAVAMVRFFLALMVKKLIFASEEGKFTRTKAHAASRS